MPYPQIHKLVVVGDERVGKTAIIEQLIFGNHVIGQGGLPTIADIYDIVLETEKGTHERVQIFDTPGSLFSSSTKSSEQEHYLQLADGFILVYEITSKASYELVVSIQKKISKEVPVILIGNKCDCNAIREVSTDRATSWARSYGIKPYEVTVIHRDSLKEPFCYMAWRMANPSRGFSSLPILTSATSSKPHPLSADHAPFNRDMAQGLGKVDELHRGRSRERSPSLTMSHVTDGCPEDALFPPKKGAATLFLGDCLSTKGKPKQDHTSNH